MAQIMWFALLLVWPLLAVGSPHEARQATCTTRRVHKPWGMLTTSEKSAYINAELCLMAAPTKLRVPGARTRWDDLQWNHIVQAHVMHDVGHFLPWHRYFIVVHGNLLRDECGYNGPLPYWDETADATLSNLANSAIFQANAFGGNGAGINRYISNGPFSATTLRLRRPNQAAANYRISRNFNTNALRSARIASLDACFQLSTYNAAWECLHGSPHGGGHVATGGIMNDVYASPGDPVFYLHHAWLDVMWWKWQTLNLPARLTDMGGRNMPRTTYVQGLGSPLPGREFTDYHGETGSTTTLNHVLWYGGLAPNVTVRDVMDVRTGIMCADYIFSPSLNVTINSIVDGVLTEKTEL
ncbi:Tyrosinase ustQ [Paramyrothecium foliicola]|nr:Tyrosinase ustQ [Paramyrothecium foliicola]